MTRLPLSSAAAALLRALLGRAAIGRDRILLTKYRSVDWQSLTFIGERHEFGFRISGPDSEEVFQRLTGGLSDAEIEIPRRVLADVVVFGTPVRDVDGSISFDLEALTIDE